MSSAAPAISRAVRVTTTGLRYFGLGAAATCPKPPTYRGQRWQRGILFLTNRDHQALLEGGCISAPSWEHAVHARHKFVIERQTRLAGVNRRFASVRRNFNDHGR